MFSTFFGGNRRSVPLLIDGSTVLGLVLSDVIVVASRSLLFKENNVACYIQGKWRRGKSYSLYIFLRWLDGVFSVNTSHV